MSCDDITPRELELIDAILSALYDASQHGHDDDYEEGYFAACSIVARVLKMRGFKLETLKWPEE